MRWRWILSACLLLAVCAGQALGMPASAVTSPSASPSASLTASPSASAALTPSSSPSASASASSSASPSASPRATPTPSLSATSSSSLSATSSSSLSATSSSSLSATPTPSLSATSSPSLSPAASTPSPGSTAATGPITGLIVKYAASVPPPTPGDTAVKALAAAPVAMSAGEDLGFGFTTAEFPTGVSTAQAKAVAAALVRSGKVVSAEPDLPVSLFATQNPAPSWGLDRLDQAALPLAGGYSYAQDGTGVTAYIVDTGIRSTHTDFGKRVRKGFDAIPADGQKTNDCNGHGTHVAGTVGGSTYGVAKNVSLVAVRVLGCGGSGTVSYMISALSWIVTDHVAGVPAVANMSVGSAKSDALNAAVQSAINDGVTVVVASGNSDVDACNTSPASAPNAITVNATGDYTKSGTAAATDSRAVFSNWGSCTDIYAPGSAIKSDWFTDDTATAFESGTSMASPHVAGVAARILQANPSFTPAQVWTAMSAAATTLSSDTLHNANGTAATLGTGAAISGGDTMKFVYIAGTAVPGAPRTLTTKTSSGTVTATWVAPLSSGTSAITGYTATAYSALTGGSSLGTCTTLKLSCAITGLTGGVTVYVSVTATSATGSSEASTPRVAQVLAATGPGAPTSVFAAREGSGAIAVMWTAPTATGGSAITGFTASAYTASTGGKAAGTCTGGASATACPITGLVGGTTYYVGVAASNAIGVGLLSSPLASIVPHSVPGAPTLATVVPATGAVTVTWTAPASNGGTDITGYRAQAWSAAKGGTVAGHCDWTSGALTCQITGLTRGVSYFIDVYATNAKGDGIASTRSKKAVPL